MVRVSFVAAPVKRDFFLSMIQHFSGSLETEVVAPSYPRTRAGPQGSGLWNVFESMLGDSDTRKALAKFNPDVVYTDSPLYAFHLKLSQLAPQRKIPIIVHLRGDLWREFFEWGKRSRVKSKLLGFPLYASSLLGVGLADRVTPICRWLQSEVRRHLPSKPTEVVYQGVDPAEFFPTPGIELKHPAVAIIQNHTVYEKTLGLLNFGTVISKLPEVNFYVSSGEDIRQSYFPLVEKSLGQFKNVHFLSGIGHPEGVRRLLASSDLYVLASNLDCCPTTVLEASLMRKPVLGSRVGGVPEIISDGLTGWSIDNQNIDEWVHRIRSLIEDAKLAERLGTEGRKWVSENFGWATIAPQVERLIIDEAERAARRQQL
ncbi:MAG: glycosyltransferase family 4 protein [Candidatus Bathyarchaeia archaeon]